MTKAIHAFVTVHNRNKKVSEARLLSQCKIQHEFLNILVRLALSTKLINQFRVIANERIVSTHFKQWATKFIQSKKRNNSLKVIIERK